MVQYATMRMQTPSYRIARPENIQVLSPIDSLPNVAWLHCDKSTKACTACLKVSG